MNDITNALFDKRDQLANVSINELELRKLDAMYDEPLILQVLSELYSIGIAKTAFSLDETSDPSEIGVEMEWMTPTEILEEATEAEPGISAAPLGYIPIGKCLTGSGDPYFLVVRNNVIFVTRIPHDAVYLDGLDTDQIETISPLDDFFRMAEIR